MDVFAALAERKIQEAISRGEFDHLALKGKPLPREDLSMIPEEMRMAWRILKNAGYLPEEMQLRRDILALHDLLDGCRDPEECRQIRRRLQARQLNFDLLMERNARNSAFSAYAGPLRRQIG